MAQRNDVGERQESILNICVYITILFLKFFLLLPFSHHYIDMGVSLLLNSMHIVPVYPLSPLSFGDSP